MRPLKVLKESENSVSNRFTIDPRSRLNDDPNFSVIFHTEPHHLFNLSVPVRQGPRDNSSYTDEAVFWRLFVSRFVHWQRTLKSFTPLSNQNKKDPEPPMGIPLFL